MANQVNTNGIFFNNFEGDIREYNAEDFTRQTRAQTPNGVCGLDELTVTKIDETFIVSPGRAFINGTYREFLNAHSFTVPTGQVGYIFVESDASPEARRMDIKIISQPDILPELIQNEVTYQMPIASFNDLGKITDERIFTGAEFSTQLHDVFGDAITLSDPEVWAPFAFDSFVKAKIVGNILTVSFSLDYIGSSRYISNIAGGSGAGNLFIIFETSERPAFLPKNADKQSVFFTGSWNLGGGSAYIGALGSMPCTYRETLNGQYLAIRNNTNDSIPMSPTENSKIRGQIMYQIG